MTRLPLISFVERRSRALRIAIVALAGSVGVWFGARKVASILLDRWWFDTVTDADVWRVRTVAQLQLLAGVSVVTALVLGTSVWFVLRVGSVTPKPTNRMVV